MPLFAAAIFLSAFLLFQVQPLIARYILPWFGGSPAVWTVCLLFFQVGLLAGYAYAHALARLLGGRRRLQAAVHLALLALAVVLLPVTPSEALKPTGEESSPTWSILWLLASTVGVPYLLVSASSPLLQHWFAEAHPGRSPYRLFAVSNLGSLLGLLSYPFVFEPLLDTGGQTVFWSGGFALYAVIAVVCALVFLRRSEAAVRARGDTPLAPLPPVEGVDRFLWIAFPACGSMLLLSLTNQMCQDVAVVPFLWVLPLSLYLLTFVLAFDHPRWYWRPAAIPLAAAAVGAVVYLINRQFAATEMHLYGQIAIYCSAVFFGCLVCHGEISRLKPDTRRLTFYYLSVSLGGALGGVFVSLVAPLIFTGYWELHVTFALLALLATIVLDRRFPQSWRSRKLIGPAVVWMALLVALSVYLRRHIEDSRSGTTVAMTRSFYGVLRVFVENEGTENAYLTLHHGRISHGRQYLHDDFRDLATTYYSKEGGVGAVFAAHPARIGETARPMHVGLVGLGVGTIATYASEDDRFRFYEIDPRVEDLAREHFTFLEDCLGEETVVLGDARISLERELETEGSQQFDVIFVDAFTGDAIPIHLVTKEAFQLYFEHLKPDGVLAVHISNLHLDLSDPVRVLAGHFDKEAVRVAHSPRAGVSHAYYSDWVLVTSNERFLEEMESLDWISPWSREEPKDILWTDNFSNLLQVVMRD